MRLVQNSFCSKSELRFFNLITLLRQNGCVLNAVKGLKLNLFFKTKSCTFANERINLDYL